MEIERVILFRFSLIDVCNKGQHQIHRRILSGSSLLRNKLHEYKIKNKNLLNATRIDHFGWNFLKCSNCWRMLTMGGSFSLESAYDLPLKAFVSVILAFKLSLVCWILKWRFTCRLTKSWHIEDSLAWLKRCELRASKPSDWRWR